MKKEGGQTMFEGSFLNGSGLAELSLRRRHISKKMAVMIAGVLVVLIVGGFFFLVFVGFILNPIIPTDVRIVRTIDENKDLLASIDGVLAAGFGTNVHVDGINVYIDAAMTNTEGVPAQLGEFPVFLIRIDNSQPYDREGLLWWSPELNLNPPETPGAT